MDTDRPGREIPKEYREVVIDLIDDQGWRYSNRGKGYPKLYPADKNMAIITIARTPSDSARGFKNFVGTVRRAGGKV